MLTAEGRQASVAVATIAKSSVGLQPKCQQTDNSFGLVEGTSQELGTIAKRSTAVAARVQKNMQTTNVSASSKGTPQKRGGT